ncbi:hypothetical protein KQY30_31950 [Streptomyces sp. GMY02]|uniref:hypothetical protein n=1 Tax=Streptomyces sp. GMY02 TaxID=1333528 RepID=UPI001C2C26FE|nr:hypothetical protein [Streptomyces sp. GMY02]QXE38159.1 hypothetical protein KQY30_31950 [Streptomyces sp. GMY02]
MFDIDQISNAAAELTGESLEDARRRLGNRSRYDHLIPDADRSGQALLESTLLSALGATTGGDRPFGIREAKITEHGLDLRVERAEDVRALLGLLPLRTKWGPWRGVRELTAQPVRTRLRFGLREWVYNPEGYGRSPAPEVRVAGPHGVDLEVLLTAHRKQTESAGHTVRWDPQDTEPQPKRQEPIARSLVRQLSASSAMGSRLLRRPRLWDHLAGYAGVHLSTHITDYGLDWILERQIAGPHLDHERLLAVLTDPVVGYGFAALDHVCSTEECTIRAVHPGRWNSRGVLTVRSRQAPITAEPPRPSLPLTMLGERPRASRPRAQRQAGPVEPDRSGVVLQLLGDGGRDQLVWVAERIAAAWAAEGLVTAVVAARAHKGFVFRDPSQPDWATASSPTAEAGWQRLRIVSPPGQLWLREPARSAGPVASAVAEARRFADRVVLVSRDADYVLEEAKYTQLVDVRLLVRGASRYQRHLALPPSSCGAASAVALTPAESAIDWRQKNWSYETARLPVTGLLLLLHADEDEALDEFDHAVEEQLARYGTPVLGRFPDHGPIVRGMSHSTHPPTVLDPETAPSAHARMMKAAADLGQRLSPELPAGTRATPPDDVATAPVTPTP